MKLTSKIAKVVSLVSACSALGFCVATGQESSPTAAKTQVEVRAAPAPTAAVGGVTVEVRR